MTLQALSLVLFGFGLVLGVLAAKFIARRSAAQPIGMDPEKEASLLGVVLRQQGLYPAVAELEPEMFVLEPHQRIWAAVKAEVLKAAGADLQARDEKELAALAEQVPADLAERVISTLEAADARLATDLAAREESKTTSLKRALKLGAVVLDGHVDRTKLAGIAPIVPGGPGEPPLVRRYVQPGWKRTLATMLGLAIGFGAAPCLILERTEIESGLAQWLAIAALVVLTFVSVVVAFVDWDTFYIEVPTFWTGTLVAWGLTVAAQFLDGAPGRLLVGLGVVLGLAVFFEVTTAVHSKLRGTMKQGFGDTQILAATAGIPAALAGSVTLGIWAMLAGSMLAILGWVVLAAQKKVTKDSPFAFGPYLALGWILAWSLVPMSLLSVV